MDQIESISRLAKLALSAVKPDVTAILVGSDIYPVESLPVKLLPPLVSFSNAFSIFVETEKCLNVRVVAQDGDSFGIEVMNEIGDDPAKAMLMFVEVWGQMIEECELSDNVLNITPITTMFKPSRFGKSTGEELNPDDLIPVVIAYGLDKAGVLSADVTTTLAKTISAKEENRFEGPSI
ncbi:hypothetical protein [Shewanella colwelliana]|uniref:hypothetical protein n=1 Tax=Shewanella colwelliana TaxID=23 RepID=UPI0022AEB72A|nr:hypothetical protein [Shewanella colwelliana]MCZ4337793.1 hypothetical protein [Shewanella colwelliana]